MDTTPETSGGEYLPSPAGCAALWWINVALGVLSAALHWPTSERPLRTPALAGSVALAAGGWGRGLGGDLRSQERGSCREIRRIEPDLLIAGVEQGSNQLPGTESAVVDKVLPFLPPI